MHSQVFPSILPTGVLLFSVPSWLPKRYGMTSIYQMLILLSFILSSLLKKSTLWNKSSLNYSNTTLLSRVPFMLNTTSNSELSLRTNLNSLLPLLMSIKKRNLNQDPNKCKTEKRKKLKRMLSHTMKSKLKDPMLLSMFELNIWLSQKY